MLLTVNNFKWYVVLSIIIYEVTTPLTLGLFDYRVDYRGSTVHDPQTTIYVGDCL